MDVLHLQDFLNIRVLFQILRKKEKQIAEVEAAIAKLEQEQQEIETLLTEIENQTTENFQRYEHIKREMEQRLYEWEILSEEE